MVHHKTVMEPVNIFHHGLRKENIPKDEEEEKEKKEGKKNGYEGKKMDE